MVDEGDKKSSWTEVLDTEPFLGGRISSGERVRNPGDTPRRDRLPSAPDGRSRAGRVGAERARAVFLASQEPLIKVSAYGMPRP